MTTSIRSEFRSAERSGAGARRARGSGGRLRARAVVALTPGRVRAAGIGVVSLGFVLAVVAASATYGFTSDDVFVQNIVESLTAGQAFAPVVGGDNFAIKAPLYLLIGALLPHSPFALTVTVLLVNAPLVFALVVVVDRAVARRGPLALAGAYLLIAWFLVSRIAPMSSVMIPNGRNGEIGIAVLLMAWWCGGATGAGRRAARLVSVLLLAVLFFSDGFFLYVLLPACAAVAGIAWLLRLAYLRRAVTVLAAVAAAAVLSQLMIKAAERAGMLVLQNYVNALPVPGDVPQYLATTVGALARDLNGDAAGRPLGLAAAPALIQVALLGLLMALTVLIVRRRALSDLRVALGAAAVAVNLALYVLTSNASDPYSFRYVLLAAVIVVMLGAAGVAELQPPSLPVRRLASVVALMGVVAIALGVGLNARTTARAASGDLPDPQARVHRIIEIAQSRGLSVGLGDYWDSNITTYLSSDAVRVVPQDCTAGRMATRVWLINRADAEVASRARFVVINNTIGCTAAVVRKTFGSPLEEVPLAEPGDAVWIYGRDLG